MATTPLKSSVDNITAPLPTLDQVHVRTASQQQIHAIFHETYPAWGQSLTLEQYIARESLLGNHLFSQPKHTYILVRKNAPENTLEIFASCESFLRPALVARSSTDAQHDTSIAVEEILVTSIASVFTPEKYRRHGYAAFLMKEVRRLSESLQHASASTLYSDIGDQFYRIHGGWFGQSAWQIVIDVHAYDRDPFLPRETRYIARDEAHLILDSFPKDMQQSMHHKIHDYRQLGQFITLFGIVPTVDTLEWRWLRPGFYAPLFNHPISNHVGTIIAGNCSTSNMENSEFMLWEHNWSKKRLSVLLARYNSIEHALKLIYDAINEARQYNLPKIVMWLSEERFILENEAWKDLAATHTWITLEQRDLNDSLPSLSWFSSQEPVDRVLWMYNEDFAWV